ncbi:hypothetical protein C9J03_02750 [Photobacterium gaetbulicola]|uniref:Uncharacterized protein n=1 Tax=Photobacterium gaetbulicola Gung47 TaxID=658445 RepID=A0A0C5WX10_9GAMM|nr:tetratricopeptide repeat protein [Photobacterium gaetbulicola]AJR09569.1 hypothetical protein H744_2c2916 [Photobacterium gaetbulicola Gung47]PSU14362.1 hypothetical protein C9J03_02750 [Photobacterium gaetbulicola]
MKIDLTPTATLTLQEAFQLGVNTYQEGNKAKAREIFESILEKAPEAIDVLQVLAVLDADDGQYLKAENKLRKALSLCPDDTAIQLDLAHTLKLQGRNIDALALLGEILTVSPQHQGALQLQGEIHKATGNRSQKADKTLKQVSQQKDHQLELEIQKTLETVVQLLTGQHYQPAEQLLQSMLLLCPQNLDLQLKLATVYTLQEKYTNATHQLKSALALSPSSENIILMLAKLYRHTKQYEAGVIACTTFAKNTPQLGPELGKLFSELLMLKGEYHDAYEMSRQLLRQMPSDPEVLWVNAISFFKKVTEKQLFSSELIEQAAKKLTAALDANLDNHEKAIKLSQGMFDLTYLSGDFQQAEQYLNAVSEHYPDDVKVQWNRHILYRYHQQWEQYYQAYESGIETGDRTSYKVNKPYWTPERPFSDKVLVVREQGVGDEVLFAHNLNYLIAKVSQVYLACDERLVPMMQLAFPSIELIPIKANSATIQNQIKLKLLENIDSWLPMGSISQYIFKETGKHWHDEKFVQFPDEMQQSWQHKVNDSSKPTSLKIGISWRSGLRSGARNRNYLSINDVAHFMKQFPNATFYNLQYGDCDKELKKLKKLTGIDVITFDELDLKDDFLSTAALINSLDAVFTSGSSVFRLTVAVGKPCYVFVAREQNDCYTQPISFYGEGKDKRHEKMFAYPPLIDNKFPVVEAIANCIKKDFGI